MRDVNNGWLIRYTHANVASFFFIFVYAQNYKFIISNNLFFSNLTFAKAACYILDFFLSITRKHLPLKGNLILFCYLLVQKSISDIFFEQKIFRPLDNKFRLSDLDSKDMENKNIKNPKKFWELDNEAFLQWFVGFTDSEGTFIIQTKNNSEVNFCFKFTLHVDDSAVLFLIKDILGIGVVTIKGNTCTFAVHSFQLIVEVLLPIFDKYPLITHKQLDYREWRIAVLLKNSEKNASNKKISITAETFIKIVKIKESINSNRTKFDGYKLSYSMISKYWLLGFVEGDGSFHFTNNRAIFSITQKDRQVLDAISIYLKNIPRAPIINGLYVSPHPNSIIGGKNNNTAYQLTISDTDVLFQFIFPFFNNLTFLSRKGVDFKIWSVGLFLIINGYSKIPKGKAILLKLSNNMNSKRYFSNIIDFIDIEEINALFEIEPPFNIFSKKSHFTLAKEYAIK